MQRCEKCQRQAELDAWGPHIAGYCPECNQYLGTKHWNVLPYRFKTGKYAGKTLDKVSDDYLNWVCENTKLEEVGIDAIRIFQRKNKGIW